MKKQIKRFVSLLLVFGMIFSFIPTAFADSIPEDEGIQIIASQGKLESKIGNFNIKEVEPTQNSTVKIQDLSNAELVRGSLKDFKANELGKGQFLNAEETQYIEDVATALSKPIGAIDLDDFGLKENIKVIVWLQQLPTALADAYGAKVKSLTKSYELAGAKARMQIKSNYSSISTNFSGQNIPAITYEYETVFSGFAMTISAKQAKEIAAMPGVYAVTPDTEVQADDIDYLDPNYTYEGMGPSREAMKIGDIHATGITGKNVIVGVLDTGIDYNHPDLKGVYKGGYNYIPAASDAGRPAEFANTPMETTYAQFKASGKDEKNTSGSEYYTDHGTHVSGTIAARPKNSESSDTYKALGMAPDVDLYVARVLGPYGTGDTSWIIAAVEDFTSGNDSRGIPKAHVINLSLGANRNTAYGDNVYALNNAVIAGVNVAVSAGNNATPAGNSTMKARDNRTLGSPGTAYLPVTVAAAQYGGETEKTYENVSVSNGTDSKSFKLLVEGRDPDNSFINGKIEGTPSPTYIDKKGYELYLAFAGTETPEATAYTAKLNAIPDGSLEGKVLVVQRGIDFTVYRSTALRTNAGALIVINRDEAVIGSMSISGTVKGSLPIFSAPLSARVKLTELATSGKTIHMNLGDITVKPTAKLPAYFSSIGPVEPTVGLKPDIIAPGWQIGSTAPAFIVNPDHNETDYSVAYQNMGGTSMSAPHIAGILALMVQAYPEANPAEIKARLMNTSKVDFIKTTDDVKEYEASVTEVGAGFVNPYRAIIEEKNKGVFITVTDDKIPSGLADKSVIETNQTLSSLSFGIVSKGDLSRKLPVKVSGSTDFSVKVIYNDNTRYSKNSTKNEVKLELSTPINGEFEAWVNVPETAEQGLYEGYLIITADGKEYSLPWLVSVGKMVSKFKNLLFFPERPIISTSNDQNVRSANFSLKLSDKISTTMSSNKTTLWFTWAGGEWPVDKNGDAGLELYLVNTETEDIDYYYSFINMAGQENDGTGMFRITDFVADKAFKVTDDGLGAKESIANGTYYLAVYANDKFYLYDDVGVVFTDGKDDYAVQLDLDEKILANADESKETASVNGRIFSPALEKAAEVGIAWFEAYEYFNTPYGYYDIDQSFNILGYSTTGNISDAASIPAVYNLVTVDGNLVECDSDGYFNVTVPLTQEQKDGGFVFTLDVNHSVVGVEGFYKNWNGYLHPDDVISIGANKSKAVTPTFAVGPTIDIVSADYSRIVANITSGSAITGSGITAPTVNSFNAEYSIDGGSTYNKLTLTDVIMNEEETEITISYKPIRFTTQEEVIIRLKYLETEYETDSFDSGIVKVDSVLAINDEGLLAILLDYAPYNEPDGSEFTITCEGGQNPQDDKQKFKYLGYDPEYNMVIFSFTPYKATNQDQNITISVEFNGVSTDSNSIFVSAEYKVTFNSNGGSEVAAIAGLAKDSIITEPVAPTKSNYRFAGWYKEAELINKWDFATDKVTSDITLYAKWNYIPPTDPGDGGGTGGTTPTTPSTPTTQTTPTTPSTPDPVKPVEFNDTTNHWAKNDIEFIAGLGLVNGTGDGTFSPNAQMTRAMIVTILGRFAKVDEAGYANNSSFIDVAGGKYYTAFAAWAAQNDIVKGMPDGRFNPDAPLTRETLALILMNYAKAMNLKLISSENNIKFKDADKISSWAKDGVEWARSFGIVTGDTAQNFNPQKSITRAEVATMLARFIRLIEQ